ncbi:MAG: Zn-dependent protease [Myxococcales bacterium]|nr:Zn-dependent protease [Myxococcales bacterium]
MISRRALVSALGHRDVAEWVLVERVQELATVDEAHPLRREELRTRWTVLVHRDVAHGRGTARIELGSFHGSAREIVDQALSLAEAAVGPAWRSTPPAAPAKVRVLDDKLETARLPEVAASFLSTLRRPPRSNVTASIELLRERVVVQASSGFRTTWMATSARAQALVSVGERSIEVQREARRLDDLQLAPALVDAVGDLTSLATASVPAPGRCAIVLHAEALLHGGGLGVWSVFADHATAEVERQGLMRYRLRAPIAPGAEAIPEPLTITSDGSLDFATRSAPVGDEGDAVRRFALVERGISVGLGMSMREAARRRGDPNGGVRNLVIDRGTWSGALPTTRTLDIRRLRSLSIDPYTGDASLELALGYEGTRPITGGTLRLDLVTALARAHRSATVIHRGAYVGPSAVWIDDAELLA